MKKSLLVLPLLAVSLAGCDPLPSDSSTGEGALLAIEVASGLKEEYEQDALVDLGEVIVTAHYENADLAILGENLTFNPDSIDTSEIGEFELMITYATESVIWTYAVVEYYEIDNISAPDFVTTYLNNIALKSEANKRSEFMDRAQGYAVGDDNPFRFFPNIYAYNSDDEEIDVTSYHSYSVLRIQNGNDWIMLSGAERDAMVAIDEFASTYDFTEAAIGSTFELTVRPHGDRYAIAPKYSTSFEFSIVDGYNVYTQDDLSHFNNVGTHWDVYRTAHSLTQVALNGLIFQNDIEIVRDNLPDSFFYMPGDPEVSSGDADIARVYGSLRDEISLYHRDILPGEDFVIDGNYFNFDFSTLPVVVREDGRIDALPGLVISHATVIKAGEAQTGENFGHFTMKNLSIVGNANRTEQPEKSGGALFHKVMSVNAHLYNTIATQCFTIFLTELTSPSVVIEKSRGYDTFSSLLYNWGTNDLLIKDSEYIGAGGPVIINDHVSPEADGTGGNQPHTKVENSILESFVSGNENWFRLVDATAAVPGIISIGDNLLPAYGTNSITKDININGVNVPHFNLIALIKDGAIAKPTSSKVNGTFQIDDTIALDLAGPFMSGVAAFPVAMPRFQSSDGQVALFDGEKLVDTANQAIIPYAYTGENYFAGDYMNMYYNIGSGDGFMGFTFGLIDSAA